MDKKIALNQHISSPSAPYSAQKKKIAQLLGAHDSDHLFLTSGIPEAHFQLIFSAFQNRIRETGRTHILTLEFEEETILDSIKSLEPFGIYGKFLPVNEQGQLTGQILKEEIKPRSAMLSISFANSYTGVIHPIWDLCQICREKGILLHLDITSVIGKLYFHLQDFEADFFTFGGPDIGAVVAKEGFMPCYKNRDSLSQLNRLSNFLEEQISQMDHVGTEIARLRDKLEQGVQEAFPDALLFFQNAHRLPNISALAIPGVQAASLAYLLKLENVDIELGRLPSILKLLGVEDPLCHSGLSFGLSAQTKEEEIDRVLEILISNAKKLQSYSGVYV